MKIKETQAVRSFINGQPVDLALVRAGIGRDVDEQLNYGETGPTTGLLFRRLLEHVGRADLIPPDCDTVVYDAVNQALDAGEDRLSLIFRNLIAELSGRAG